MIIQAMNHSELDGVAPVPHLAVLRVQGEEAAKFLHAQLTQDFALLGSSEARLAAFCSAKGRMLATFIGFKRREDDILLVCRRDLLPGTLKRLSMFVLRTKARLSDAGDAFALCGLAGPSAAGMVDAAAAPWSRVELGAASVVALYPADGVARALWIAPAGEPGPTGPALDTERWRAGEIRSGVAMVSLATADAFVPQMLNYESVGGVNFKKGCYPGQEVVARSQFRGTLKRRAFLASAAAPMAPGQDLFAAGDPDAEACATVVEAASAGNGDYVAIVSGQISVLGERPVRLGSPAGPLVRIEAMPYPLREDI